MSKYSVETKYNLVISVLLFIIFILFPVGLYLGCIAMEKRVIENKKKGADVIYNMISHEFDSIISGAKKDLEQWAIEIESGEFPDTFNTDRTKVLDANQYVLNYGVNDVDGYSLCAQRELPEGFNFNDEVLEYAQFVKDEEFAVTNFGISQSTGLPRIGFGYPLFDSNGDFDGAVFSSLSLESIGESLMDIGLPEDSELLITDPNGAIEVKLPPTGSALGEKEFSLTVFSLILSAKEGVLEYENEEGQKYIYVYKPYYVEGATSPSNFIIYGVKYDGWALGF